MSRTGTLWIAVALVAAGCGARHRTAAPADALSSTWPARTTVDPRAGAVVVGTMNHLCMRPPSGATYCVGSNFAQELGTTGEFDVLARADRFLPDDRDLSLGSSVGCAIAANGETRCWGSPFRGGRGDDCTINRDGHHVCGGTEVATETSPRRVLGVPALRELSGGWNHTCGRSDDGEVWCWGSNVDGQIGRPEIDEAALRPVRVDVPPALELHSGANHTCTVSRDTRDVWCWGSRFINDEPDPMERDLRAPKRLAKPLPAGARLRLTAWGACVIDGDALRCWGRVATDPDGPVELAGLDLVSNGSFSCVLDRDRQVACYADAAFVGGEDDEGGRWRAVALPTRSPIAELFATHDHACAISESGEVACWGDAMLGSLDLAAPLLVLDPARLPQ